MADDSLTLAREGSILVVEDEQSWYEIYEDLLGARYDLRMATTYADAWLALQREKFDVAIVDPTLDRQDPDNRDGIRLIKDAYHTLDPDLRIIVVTGDSTRVKRDDPGLEGFVVAVLQKEGSSERSTATAILEEVQAALRRKQAENRWLYICRQTLAVGAYDAYKKTLEQLCMLTGADVAHLMIPTERFTDLEVIVDTGEDEGRLFSVNASVAGLSFRTGQVQNIADVSQHTEYQPVTMSGDARSMGSELAVPVLLHGSIIGVLNIESHQPAAFNDHHQKIVEAFAELAILIAQSGRRQKELEELRLSARTILQSALNPESVWRIVLQRGCELINARAGYLVRSIDRDELMIEASTDRQYIGDTLSRHASVPGLVFNNRIPRRIGNLQQDEETLRLATPAARGAVSLLAVPIQSGNTMFGVLCFDNDLPDAFTPNDEKLMLFLASYVSFAMAIDRARADGMQKQTALADMVVHSVGNPIRSMRNLMLEFERSGLNSLPAQHPDLTELLYELHREVNQLLKVINRVREDSLLKATDVNACMNRAVGQLRNRIEHEYQGRQIAIQLNMQSDLPMAVADDSLEDVFKSLLDNALEAIKQSGELKIETTLEDDWIVVRVTDTGVGISSSHLERVFAYGFSTKSNPSSTNGMGLSWCKRYLESCSGTIVAESTVGHGTTMTITLRVLHDHDTDTGLTS